MTNKPIQVVVDPVLLLQKFFCMPYWATVLIISGANLSFL